MCDCSNLLGSTTPPETDFSERLLSMVSGGMISLMVSIGHRTGLFDTMAEMPPSTSEEIAKASNLNERYVREWLGALTTARILTYDEALGTYQLPAEHAAFLTRKATPSNMATLAQWISVLGSVEDRIVECFHKGGGLQYSDYNRFHEVMAEESGQTTVAALTTAILPAVPGLVEKLETGIEVVDVGCAAGRALIRMAEEYPNSRFTGYEISDDALAMARQEAEAKGLKNITFQKQDAARIADQKRFDLITTFDVIHDQARPDVVLANINKALKDDGVYLMQDIKSSSHVHKNMDNPLAPLIYTISCMHCMSVSLGQNGMGLGAAWGSELALNMLADAGFTRIEMTDLEHDIQNSYYIVQK